MEVTAIVVARRGSLRVKNKNLLPFKETTLFTNIESGKQEFKITHKSIQHLN